MMLKKDTPLFVFSVKFHELYCLVDKEDPEKIVDGTEHRKVLNDFVLYVMYHPEP